MSQLLQILRPLLLLAGMAATTAAPLKVPVYLSTNPGAAGAFHDDGLMIIFNMN